MFTACLFVILISVNLGYANVHNRDQAIRLRKTRAIIENTCTPLEGATPCFKWTHYNSTTGYIYQISDEKMNQLTVACAEDIICSREYVRMKLCCTTVQCLGQCYGPPFVFQDLTEVLEKPVIRSLQIKFHFENGFEQL